MLRSPKNDSFLCFPKRLYCQLFQGNATVDELNLGLNYD